MFGLTPVIRTKIKPENLTAVVMRRKIDWTPLCEAAGHLYSIYCTHVYIYFTYITYYIHFNIFVNVFIWFFKLQEENPKK